MLKLLRKLFLISILPFISGIIINGCAEEPLPSLWEGPPSGAKPVITSISPAEALAGITVLTIDGLNFSPVKENNQVTFNGVPAEILQASANQLIVRAPNVPSDTVIVLASVVPNEPFSDTVFYSLLPAVQEVLTIATTTPLGITLDIQNNLYASYRFDDGKNIVYRIAQTGTTDTFGLRNSGGINWSSLRIGPGGVLYGVRSLRAIFKFPGGGGDATSWVSLPAGTLISTIDFDASGNMWAGGNNTVIFRIKQDLTFTSYPFDAEIRALRVFQDYLYAAGVQNSETKVWRFPIDANGDLGTVEVYYDFTANHGTAKSVFALEFAMDGDMYLGTNLPSSILIVHPDKSSEPLYPGVLLESAPALAFAWDTGNFLYYTRERTLNADGTINQPQILFKLNMQKPGAPYYGRQ